MRQTNTTTAESTVFVTRAVHRIATFILATSPVLLSFSLPSIRLCGEERSVPNIIFILSDDLSWGDLGCYGQREIQTPNIDRLAAEGMRFTNAYAGNSVCRSEEHTSELQSRRNLVCRLLLEKKKNH